MERSLCTLDTPPVVHPPVAHSPENGVSTPQNSGLVAPTPFNGEKQIRNQAVSRYFACNPLPQAVSAGYSDP